jgi:arabinogalactan oligomer/maltooligosaccharide transport system permease protein
MTTQSGVTSAGSDSSPRSGRFAPAPQQRNGDRKPALEPSRRQITTGFIIGRLIALGIAGAIALYAAPPLIQEKNWIGLAIMAAATVVVLYLYLSPRHVAAKYLVPGTLFLIAFQILPVLFTVSTAFSNFGDGHLGSKDDAIVAVQTSSVVQVPGSPEYLMTPATKDGKLVFLLVDTQTKAVQAGNQDGLTSVEGASLGFTGKVLSAPGYTVITDAPAHGEEISAFAVPTATGAIKAIGLSRAYEGKATRSYDAGCDCVTDTATGKTFTADEAQGSFIAADGERIAQGWRVNTGFKNFQRIFTDPTISKPFLKVLVWNFAFSGLSVLFQFMLGMLVAMAMHGVRLKARRLYRVLLVLPFAMPSFAMLLVWRDMFNTDFGLINRLLGTHIDWIGEPNTARFALILMNVWMGFPYMFLVTTGALQAIPSELTDASRVDGASGWQAYRRVTLPLLLVALTPLLIASFAYNFNNFNAIRLVSNGGPYDIDNNTVGATDLLISYTYRIAGFDSGTSRYGLAAAMSIFIFAIVATFSVIVFRKTRAQEEVYS